ncbi:MAG: glutathione S-transferase [Arenicella sp.]|jgi:glutathione S-transferase
MSNFILHHYQASPFAEKIRLILGFKGLSYKAVTIPIIMPKPDLTALTGGYRKTPVLQQGPDIYCDTRLIARIIDEHANEQTLYPQDQAASANILAQWADQHLFGLAVALVFSPLGFSELAKKVPPAMIEALVKDREKLRLGATAPKVSLEMVMSQLPIFLQQFEQQLLNRGPYLLGHQPTIADFSVYHCLWFINNNAAVRSHLQPYPTLQSWLDSMKAIGHGTVENISGQDAIDLAKQGKRANNLQHDFLEFNGLKYGAQVIVQPSDYGFDPVEGELVLSLLDEVAIKRKDERAGDLYVHFPRVGYQVQSAS